MLEFSTKRTEIKHNFNIKMGNYVTFACFTYLYLFLITHMTEADVADQNSNDCVNKPEIKVYDGTLTESGVLTCSWIYTGLGHGDTPSCTITTIDPKKCVSSGGEHLNHLVMRCPELLNMRIGEMINDLPVKAPVRLPWPMDHFVIRTEIHDSQNLSMFDNITALTITGCRITFQTIAGMMEQVGFSQLKELHLDNIEYPPSSLQQIKPEEFQPFHNISILTITYGQWNDSYISNGWNGILLSMPRLSQLTIDMGMTTCWLDPDLSQFVRTAVPLNDINGMPQLQKVEVSIILPGCENWNFSHLSLSNLSAFHFASVDVGCQYTLNVSHNELDILTIHYDNTSLQTIDVSNNYIRSLEKIRFDGLRRLKELKLSHNMIDSIDSSCFYDLPSLEILHLDHNEIFYLSGDSLEGLDALLELDLSHNKLSNILYSQFKSDSKLQKLLLNNNHFKAVDHNQFSIPLSVRYLDLSSNPLQESKFYRISRSYIKIDRLQKYRITAAMPYQSDSILETLLSNFESDQRMSNLYLCNKKSAEFLMPGVSPMCSVHHKIILHNITVNYLGLDFLLTTTDHASLSYSSVLPVLDRVSVDLGKSQLECGCKDIFSYFILNWLYNNNEMTNDFYKTNWICGSPGDVAGTPFLQAPQRIFKACTTNLPNCPKKCACYHDIRNMDRITVDCTGEYLSELPSVVPEGTEVLLAPNTNIKSLCTEREHFENVIKHGYLQNLIELDVSGNNITEVCEEFVQELNVTKLEILNLENNDLQSLPKNIQSLENTTIFLMGNEMACTCENTWLKYWISNRQSLMPGANLISCKNIEDSYFLEIDDTILTDLCTDNTVHVSWLGLALGSIAALVLVLVAGFLMYKFWKRIKVWCFVKFNWHPFDHGDMDDNIENMDYDVFISYSHLDLIWVRENLMEFLQGNGYSVCLHEKDWPAGVLITENILLSVKHSRRMIMVLSQNYLSSEWCRVEFQVAHRAILEGRTKYLIMVALEDVVLENLPAEIDFYVKTHTYLEVDNGWFQKRLMYAMPQKPLSEIRDENHGNDIELQGQNGNRCRFLFKGTVDLWSYIIA